MKKRSRDGLAVIVVIAAGIATTGILTSAGATSAARRTIQFRVSLSGQRLVDNSSPTGISPGDQLVFYGVYHHRRARVGGDRESCLLVQRRPALLTCTFAARVPGGQLVAEGKLNPQQLPWTIPVVGGTGEFVGARGTLTSTQGAKESEHFVFRLTS